MEAVYIIIPAAAVLALVLVLVRRTIAAERELAIRTESIRQSEAALGQASARIVEIQGDLRVVTAKLEGAIADKAQVSADLAAREEACRRLEAVDQELRGEVRDAKHELETARQALEALRIEHGKLRAEHDEAAGRHDDKSKALIAENQRLLAERDTAAEQLERVRQDLETLRAEHAALDKEHEAHLRHSEERYREVVLAKDGATRELNETRALFDTARQDLEALRVAHAKLQTEQAETVKQAEEKLALLGEARDRMSQEFKLLAAEILAQNSASFTTASSERLDGILAPLRQGLADFQANLQAARNENAETKATLVERIRSLTEASARMTTETASLTRALKGEVQVQGAWGEMILSTILERSGLREGDEYVTQESHSTDEGKRLRPDVVVNLPGGQRVVIDSKVSLTAFEAYVNAEPGPEKDAALAAHVDSMRGHIKILTSKEYQRIHADGLDYVIMFVPIEGALAAALEKDPALTTFAVENNVVISTPTTLMIALRTIANVWQVERRNKNAEAIAERAGKLYDKFVAFLADMQGIGSRMKQAQETYDAAMGKLANGRGNIVRQVEQLRELGAKTTKAIPRDLVDGPIAALADVEAAVEEAASVIADDS